jgi:hypothetical protein
MKLITRTDGKVELTDKPTYVGAFCRTFVPYSAEKYDKQLVLSYRNDPVCPTCFDYHVAKGKSNIPVENTPNISTTTMSYLSCRCGKMFARVRLGKTNYYFEGSISK